MQDFTVTTANTKKVFTSATDVVTHLNYLATQAAEDASNLTALAESVAKNAEEPFTSQWRLDGNLSTHTVRKGSGDGRKK